ncbi:MAG: flavodoxin [Bacilli bacterium]|nr:flavodoxin [Bacilli bacterium]
MKVEVRYYSRSGNTKSLAEAIAKGVNTKAISIDDSNALISDKTDILFIGGALYAYGLDNKIKEYISNLDPNNIGASIVFSTSWISKHSIDLIKKALRNKGINVVEDYIYYKNKPNDNELKEAEEIAKKLIEEKKGER